MIGNKMTGSKIVLDNPGINSISFNLISLASVYYSMGDYAPATSEEQVQLACAITTTDGSIVILALIFMSSLKAR